VTATNGTPVEVGTRGLYIDFASSTTYASGTAYQVNAGTQAASALSLDATYSGASITPSSTTTSANPAWVGGTTTVTGGGVGATTYGTAVKFVSAALNTGMGTYTLDPGASVTSDTSSWAASYTAGVQYSIVTGP
jgi:hypothetical protein